MIRLVAAVLVATALLFTAGIVLGAPPDATFDASMSMPVATPTLVTAAPATVAPDRPPLSAADTSALVAFALTAAAFYLRKWSPPKTWAHSTQALHIVCGAASILTVLSGVVAEKGLSVRAMVTAVVAYGTAAMAQSNASSPGVNAPEKKVAPQVDVPPPKADTA